MVLRLRRLRHRIAGPRSEAGFSLRHLLRSCWHADRGIGRLLCREAEFLVVDAEMSSLDLRKGELLSVGWVVIRDGRINLSSARHLLLKPSQTVGDSAAVHNLRDCELQEGMSEAEMLGKLLRAARGRVLVFHHAPLDLAYLNRSSKRLCGSPLLLPVIDTLKQEKLRLERRNLPLGDNVLRLASCRARYNLPDYPAHNALLDALATAELFLAQLAHRGAQVRVRELL